MTDTNEGLSEIENKSGLREELNSPGRQIDFYEALADAQSDMGEGVSVYDGHTRRLLYVNNAVCKMFGYSKEELYEMSSVFDLVAPEVRKEQLARNAMRLGDIGVSEGQETVGLKKDGTRIALEYSTKRIEGDETKFVGLMRDITRRKKAEQAAREAYQVVDDLYNKAPCGYHSVDKDGYFLHINDTLLHWVGWSREELFEQRRKVFDFVAPKDRERATKAFYEFVNNKKAAKIEFEMIDKGGKTFPVLIQSTPEVDGAGQFLFTRSTSLNMTGYEKAESGDRTVDVSLKKLFSEMTDLAIATLNTELKVSSWSSGAEKIMLYSEAEALGQNFFQLFSGEEPALEHLTERQEAEGWRRRKDGSMFWCHYFICPFQAAHGSRGGYWCVFRDISEVKRLEDSLLEAQCRDMVIRAKSVNTFIIISPDSKFLFVGPVFEAVTGWRANDWIGKDFSELIHPADRQFVTQMMGRAFQSKQVPLFSTRVLAKSGHYYPVEIGARPVVSCDRLIGVAIIARWLRGNGNEPQN